MALRSGISQPLWLPEPKPLNVRVMSASVTPAGRPGTRVSLVRRDSKVSKPYSFQPRPAFSAIVEFRS